MLANAANQASVSGAIFNRQQIGLNKRCLPTVFSQDLFALPKWKTWTHSSQMITSTMLLQLDGIVNRMTVTFKLQWYIHSFEHRTNGNSHIDIHATSSVANRNIIVFQLECEKKPASTVCKTWNNVCTEYRFSIDTKAMQTISFHSTLKLIKSIEIATVFQFNLAMKSKQNIRPFGIISQEQWAIEHPLLPQRKANNSCISHNIYRTNYLFAIFRV